MSAERRKNEFQVWQMLQKQLAENPPDQDDVILERTTQTLPPLLDDEAAMFVDKPETVTKASDDVKTRREFLEYLHQVGAGNSFKPYQQNSVSKTERKSLSDKRRENLHSYIVEAM